MTDKATPRPWKYDTYYEAIFATERPTMVLERPDEEDSGHAYFPANAQLIVTAVNAWDDVAVLEARIAELRGGKS